MNTKLGYDTPIYQDVAAASGGTAAAAYTIPSFSVVFVRAYAVLWNSDGTQAGSHGGGLIAEGWYMNKNGTATELTAATGSTNPRSSGNLASSRAIASDAAFVGAGPGAPTLVLTVSTNQVIATVTNNSDSAKPAKVSIFFEVIAQGDNGI